jgi:hypothetical protein
MIRIMDTSHSGPHRAIMAYIKLLEQAVLGLRLLKNSVFNAH